MAKLNIQKCPETGICSIIKEDGSKVDILLGEVSQLHQAAGDHAKIKGILAQVDAGFAENLEKQELDQLVEKI